MDEGGGGEGGIEGGGAGGGIADGGDDGGGAAGVEGIELRQAFTNRA